MEEFKIAQLTKELVAERLKGMADPCAAAAHLIKETLSVALKSQDKAAANREAVIEEACKGGITGLLLAEQNLSRGAVLMLEAVAEVAVEHDLDPTATMECALKGLADVQRFVPPDALHVIGREIETRFMGAGQAFLELVKDGLTMNNPTQSPAA